MNQPFYKQVAKTACFAVLLAAMAFAINSCRKDSKLTGTTVTPANASTNFAVTDARTWFSQNKNSLANKIKLNSETSFLSKLTAFKPLWDSARTATDTNYYVVEAPAEYVEKIVFSTSDGKDNINGLTRLLVLKNKRNGNLSAALMQVHGDKGVNIDKVHYMNVPGSFSGSVFYTTLQGSFINGYFYTDGKIVLKSQPATAAANPTGPKILLLPSDGGCTTKIFAIYAQTCYYSANDVLQYCDPEQYLYSIEQTFCSNNQGGGGGGGIETPQCPPGTSPPAQPNPPPPGGPPVEMDLRDGKKIIRFVQGGDGDCVVDEKKEDDLANQLEAEPDLLIDCNTVKNFKSLTSFSVPQSVINRLNQLNSNSTASTLFGDPYYVQKVQDASGALINLDRFEINVNTLPTINGSQVSAEQFLEYIRLNLNSFINTSIADFVPYVDPDASVAEYYKWNSTHPLGAILHLDMADNGSVVVTDKATDHWTVSTIRTPIDGVHPVSGNRSWGFVKTGLTSYNFYVSGTDRLTTAYHSLFQTISGVPFDKADALWTSFQSKVNAFVNSHNGSSTVGTQIKERPDYLALKDYFEGKITLEQLKAKKGCN